MPKSVNKSQVIEGAIIKAIKKGSLRPFDKLPSLKQLAKKYDVSTNTVFQAYSRLREKGYITVVPGKGAYVNDSKDAQRKRIRNNCIAFIFPNMLAQYVPRIFHGIEKVVAERNYYLSVFNSLDDIKLERENLRKALEINPRGIILFPVACYKESCSNYEAFVDVQKSRVPLMFVDNYPVHLDVDYVVANDYKGAYDLTTHLIKQGHRKIAFFNGPTLISSFRERWRGYHNAMKDAGMEINFDYIYPQPDPAFDAQNWKEFSDVYSLSATYLKKLLESNSPPTALVFTLMNVVHTDILRRKNFQVPEDISVTALICEADVEFNRLLFGGLRDSLKITHSAQPDVELGEKAAETLLTIIKNSSNNRQKHMINTILRIGNSVKRLSKTSRLKLNKTVAL